MRAGLLLLLLTACKPAPAGPIPAELVGTWASPTSKLDGLTLVEGGVLYLTEHGTGMAWGTGPPPLGSTLLVWFDPATSTLYGRMAGQEAEWAKLGVFNPLSRSLGEAWLRRSGSLPDDVRKSCGPELWAPERARQKALAEAMNLYFPSFNYRELTPAERAVDRLRYREEALRFLQEAGELPLRSLATGGNFEGFRLIRVGDRPGSVRVQRDPMGKAWADVVEVSKAGARVARKREVSPGEWADLERKVREARFAELPLRVGGRSDVVDGWILEAWFGVGYKAVECPDPNRDSFRALCEYLESLGKP